MGGLEDIDEGCVWDSLEYKVFIDIGGVFSRYLEVVLVWDLGGKLVGKVRCCWCYRKWRMWY